MKSGRIVLIDLTALSNRRRSHHITHRGFVMPSMEEIEMDKRRKALDKDVISLVDKYLSEMEWSIPDADETKAQQIILDEIRQAINRIESQP